MQLTKIPWCDHTFNPWTGCGHVSAGCDNCYAAAQSRRFGRDFSQRVRTSERNWKEPLKWNKKAKDWSDRNGEICADCGSKNCSSWKGHWPLHCTDCKSEKRSRVANPLVFCGSMCEWLGDLIRLIHATPNLNWLLLTKRPEAWLQRMGDTFARLLLRGADTLKLVAWRDGNPPPNVWIGTTVENQEMADKRIPELLKIPAVGRFLSCEPLLGEVDLSRYHIGWHHCADCGHVSDPHEDIPLGSEIPCWKCSNIGSTEIGGHHLHWVICGGESGHNARPMHPDWPRGLRDQCELAEIPFFFKQWGTWHPLGTTDGRQELPFGSYELPSPEWPSGRGFFKKRKGEAHALLDGTEHKHFPKGLQK